MANFLPPAVIEIKAIADKAVAELQKVNGELNKMEKTSDKASAGINKFDKVSKLATTSLIAMGTAFAGIAALSIKEAVSMEKELTTLGVALRNVGQNSAEMRGMMDDAVGSMGDLGFAGEDAAKALTLLVTRTGSATEAQKMLGIAADVARTRGVSLATASTMLAKAQQGSTLAFRQLGITLDETLPKNEAIAKAFDELQQKVGGQAVAYTETFAGKMEVLREKIGDVQERIGGGLLPTVTKLLDKFIKLVDWVSRNKDAILKYGAIIAYAVGVVAAYNIAVKTQIAIQKGYAAVVGFSKSVLALFTKQQVAANTAMKANPIGLVVSALMLLAGAFVMAWNKSEAFRKIVIEVGKAGIKAFAFIIDVVGKLATGILKVVSGPLRLLLKGLQLLGVDAAGKVLNTMNAAIDGVGNFFESAADKVRSMEGKLDGLSKKKFKIGLEFEAPKVPDVADYTGGAVDIEGKAGKGKVKSAKDKAKEERKKQIADLEKFAKDMMKKIGEAQDRYNEARFENQKRYDERVIELNKNAEKRRTKLTQDFEEKTTELKFNAIEKKMKLEADAAKKIEAVEKRAQENRAKAESDFSRAMSEAAKRRNDDLAKLAKDNQERIADIQKSGAEKLQSIVQQSIDRLRSAFASGTSFSVGDIFKGLAESGKASAEQLLTVLKDKLNAAKLLAENASKLASAGFSQTFIEQVVSAGPEVGNELADSILKASPKTLNELKSVYNGLESVNTEGLNALATNMNLGANLATKELTDAYKAAQTETKQLLAQQNADYIQAQKDIMLAFNESVSEARSARSAAIAEINADTAEQIAQINSDLAESLLEVDTELVKALAELQKDFDANIKEVNDNLTEALGEAYKDFQETGADIQKAFDDTMADIAATVAETVNGVNVQILSSIALVQQLLALMASLGGGAAGPSGGQDLVEDPETGEKVTQAELNRRIKLRKQNPGAQQQGAVVGDITINGVNLNNPVETANEIVYAIKYGQVIQVAKGTVTTGIFAKRGERYFE